MEYAIKLKCCKLKKKNKMKESNDLKKLFIFTKMEHTHKYKK